MIAARTLLDRLLLGVPPGESPVTHVEHLPERVGITGPWPYWVPPVLRGRFEAREASAPRVYQVEAALPAHDGRSVVLSSLVLFVRVRGRLPVLRAVAGRNDAVG